LTLHRKTKFEMRRSARNISQYFDIQVSQFSVSTSQDIFNINSQYQQSCILPRKKARLHIRLDKATDKKIQTEYQLRM